MAGPEINKGKSKQVKAHSEFTQVLELGDDSPKLILPSQGLFALKSKGVQVFVKETLATPFGLLAIPWVFLDIRFQPRVADCFTVLAAVKAAVKVEHSIVGEFYSTAVEVVFRSVKVLGNKIISD